MAGEVQNSALVPLLNICIEFKAKCLETATSQSTLTLYAMRFKIPQTTENNTKTQQNENNFYLSQPKIHSFFQPLFCQRASAHLQKANANPNAYFAKELIFSIAF